MSERDLIVKWDSSKTDEVPEGGRRLPKEVAGRVAIEVARDAGDTNRTTLSDEQARGNITMRVAPKDTWYLPSYPDGDRRN